MKQALIVIIVINNNELADRNCIVSWLSHHCDRRCICGFINVFFNVTFCILLMTLALHTAEIQANCVVEAFFEQCFIKR